VTGGVRWGGLRGRSLGEPDLAERGIGAEALRRDDPLWPGYLAIVGALLIYLAFPARLTIGPNWPVPAVGLGLLAALLLATRGRRRVEYRREIEFGLVLVATLLNLIALGFLTHYLLLGGQARGVDLVNGGGVLWCANLLLFAVMYWQLDRGGPPRADDRTVTDPDFLFAPMTAGGYADPRWTPAFVDYFYLSLTNQSAFSPTDTMPLTPRAKALMGVQGVAAFITVVIIVARAVSLLD
jgi:hypothetical protein